MVATDALEGLLTRLQLTAIREQLDSLLDEAARPFGKMNKPAREILVGFPGRVTTSHRRRYRDSYLSQHARGIQH